MGNQATGRQNRIVTDKWNIPDRMEEIAVNRGLGDVQQTHRDEGGGIARAVPMETPLVRFRFRLIGRVKENRQQLESDGPNDQQQVFVDAPVYLSVPLQYD